MVLPVSLTHLSEMKLSEKVNRQCTWPRVWKEMASNTPSCKSFGKLFLGSQQRYSVLVQSIHQLSVLSFCNLRVSELTYLISGGMWTSTSRTQNSKYPVALSNKSTASLLQSGTRENRYFVYQRHSQLSYTQSLYYICTIHMEKVIQTKY